MAESATIIRQAELRIRRAVISSLVITILIFFGMLWVQVVGVTWALVIGAVVYFRLIRANRHIVWLRPFHKSDPKRFRFNTILNGASTALFIPITIQDSVFKTSYLSSYAKLILLVPVAGGMGILLSLLVIVTIGVGLSSLINQNLAIGIGLLFGLGFLTYYAFFIKKQLFKRGHFSLSSTNAMQKIESILNRIRDRKLGFQGVMIFKCPDDIWQKVVMLVVSTSSAVIIDVSDPTENVIWELKTTLQSKSPESIILAYGYKEEVNVLPVDILKKLQAVPGAEYLAQTKKFFYPAEQPPIGLKRGRMYSTLSRELKQLIVACMEKDVAFA